MRSFSHDFDRRPPVLRSAHSRRTFLKGIAATALAGGIVPFAHAAGRTGLHALSIFGDVKYPRDFAHLDYVNPAAPKGGKFTFIPGSWGYNQNPQTFNTMNGFAAKGDGPMGMDICFDSLVSGTADEPDTVYGLIAKTIDVSEDRNTFTFHMREEARFADGMPILAEDVVWSVATLTDTTKGHPSIGLSLGNLSACRALDALTVEFVFDGNQSLLQPFSAASLPVFSKAFFADRDFVGNTMDPPLGSGAYRVGRFKPGEFIEYERREDYWGKALPINIGQGNFDIVRIEFFREGLVAFQAFTKGDLDFRLEYISRNWVQKYDFDAVKKGKVIKTIFPTDKSAYMQAFFINTRRPQFADSRTREALGLAFDFEWVNQNQFFGAYTRSTSTFATSTFQANGKPEGAELALLEPFREELDPRVFDEAVIPPVSDGSGRSRDNLRKASELLSAAGWERRKGTLAKPDGTELSIEFLMRSQDFERIVSGFITNLTLLGIKAQTRLVDAAQYQDRLKTFDFDITGLARRFSVTPLEGFRSAFHSTAAVLPGSSNYCGIKLAAVDAMIEAVESARSRAEMETAARALDRILRAHFFTIPNWHLEGHRTAYWNKFSFPDVKKPDYGFPFLSTWWYDKDKAAKL